MKLSKALRIHDPCSVAFVGAGGKSTAMFLLARELVPPVLVTATTHLATSQLPLAHHHMIAGVAAREYIEAHGVQGITLFTGEIVDDRTQPVDHGLLQWLREYSVAHKIPLLIEADGSRQRPLKAPASHEPAIPPFVDIVVQVAGLSGLGKPLDEDHVHRPNLFAVISGLGEGNLVTGEAITRVLSHPDAGLKNIPTTTRRVLLLNQADTPEAQAAAGKLARDLVAVYDSVLIGSAEAKLVHSVHEQVAGVVLAAGASRRFGEPKQLLDWHGEPFVRAVAKCALAAGLSPVLVVTGAEAHRVEATTRIEGVRIVRNRDWPEGQASSIRSAVQTLMETSARRPAGAAIFLLVDQPQVTPSILTSLVERWTVSLPPILAPLVMDRRANPVLFDRSTFPDLLKLQGDAGGRAIFSDYKVEYLPWHDDRLLLDIDTPEQYARLIEDDGY